MTDKSVGNEIRKRKEKTVVDLVIDLLKKTLNIFIKNSKEMKFCYHAFRYSYDLKLA